MKSVELAQPTRIAIPRSGLIALAAGMAVCVAYGMTRGFGYGLPPYSFMYAVALGILAGLGAYAVLAIRSQWLFRGTVAFVAVAALVFVGIAYSNRHAPQTVTTQRRAYALRPTAVAVPTKPSVQVGP